MEPYTTANEALGREIAKDIDNHEARYPSGARSKCELEGAIGKQFRKLQAAFDAEDGPGTHQEIQKRLSKVAMLCLRGKKDLPKSQG